MSTKKLNDTDVPYPLTFTVLALKREKYLAIANNMGQSKMCIKSPTGHLI